MSQFTFGQLYPGCQTRTNYSYAPANPPVKFSRNVVFCYDPGDGPEAFDTL